MKTIEYRVTYQTNSGNSGDYKLEVQARDINSGFKKAATAAVKNTPKRWELVSIEFWAVKS